MITDLTKTFITGGTISALITFLASIGNKKMLNFSAFIYAAPTVFFYIVNILLYKTNKDTTIEFTKHLIYGTIASGIIVLINYLYLLRHYKRETVLFVNVTTLILIICIYSFFLRIE